MKFIFMLFSALACALSQAPAGIAAEKAAEPEGTYLYAHHDGQDLFLDLYHSPKHSPEKPTLIYIFGGGFKDGARDRQAHRVWFNDMLELGYNVVSIDYRLGLKDASDAGVNKKFIRQLENAIDLAVEDLFSATLFLIENSDELNIDADNLVLAGASAGAITALQAEWYISNSSPKASILPRGFNYSGVMAFSGAVFSRKGKVRFGTNMCPTALFHGTADTMVPYDKISFLRLHFDGSNQLAKQLVKDGKSFRIYRYTGNGHEISVAMPHIMDQILPFLEEDVIKKAGSSVDATVDNPDIPVPDWAMDDYKSLY